MIWFARFLSFACGCISLSLEILWVRYAGFAYRGAPQVFSFVLGMYLVGIAVGAALGKRYCDRAPGLCAAAGWILVVAGTLDLILPWLFVGGLRAGLLAGVVTLSAAVVTTALIKSMVFPIAHHLGSPSATVPVGSSVSKVYFANIAGATIGPLVTGFFLLQVLSLQQCLLLFAAATLALGMLCLARSGVARPAWSAAILAGGLVLLPLPNRLVPATIRATVPPEYAGTLHFLIENRYGIIHTLQGDDGDDIVFGGNAYDGRINTDLLKDSNGIARAYVLAALQAAPKRVLIIGLSGGAWARVISAFPAVERLDIVEINPGYAELVERYPSVRPLLDDPRVRIHADDGRRWLNRHPREKFDLVVMNTSLYWRAYTSLLLSREFNQLAQEHLNPGGVFAYNSTFFWDAFETSRAVFSHVYAFSNLVVCSERDLDGELAHADERLAAIRIDGYQVVDPTRPEVAKKIERMVAGVRVFDPAQNSVGRDLEVITDQNMLNEYRYGRSIFGFLRSEAIFARGVRDADLSASNARVSTAAASDRTDDSVLGHRWVHP